MPKNLFCNFCKLQYDILNMPKNNLLKVKTCIMNLELNAMLSGDFLQSKVKVSKTVLKT